MLQQGSIPFGILVAIATLAMASGCGDGDAGSSGSDQDSAHSAAAPTCDDVQVQRAKSVTYQAPKQMVERGEELTAVVATSCGTFSIALDSKRFRNAVNSFAFLAKRGFYEGVPFDQAGGGRYLHGGDPPGKAKGPGYTVIERAPSSFIYRHGVVALEQPGARRPGQAGSQFFIVLAEPWLDIGGGYPPIGTVEDGFDVLDRISRLGPHVEGSTNLGVLGPIGELRHPVVIEDISIEHGGDSS